MCCKSMCHFNMRVSGVCILYESNCLHFYVLAYNITSYGCCSLGGYVFSLNFCRKKPHIFSNLSFVNGKNYQLEKQIHETSNTFNLCIHYYTISKYLLKFLNESVGKKTYRYVSFLRTFVWT